MPLLGLLVVLMVAFIALNPRANVPDWIGATLRAAVPLAILAGCQTLVMLTGGIDLSVAATASMAAFVAASLLESQGLAVAILVPLLIAVLIGVVNGIGVGVFRVHPLIMTLGMGLVIFGASNAWQLLDSPDVVGRSRRSSGSGRPPCSTSSRYSLLVFVPLAVVILVGLRRTGYGRLLYAIGDNPVAARLSGARSWQVLVVLYVISAVLAAIAGFLISGLHQRRQRHARRSVPAPIGRRGRHRRHLDLRRPRRLRRDDRRRADPDGRHVAALLARVPRGGPPDPLRVDHRRSSRPPTPG